MNKDKQLIDKIYKLILGLIEDHNKIVLSNSYTDIEKSVITDVKTLVSDKQFTIELYEYIEPELNAFIEEYSHTVEDLNDDGEYTYDDYRKDRDIIQQRGFIISELNCKMVKYSDNKLKELLKTKYNIEDETLVDDYIQFFDDSNTIVIYGLPLINEIEIQVIDKICG